MDKSVEEIVIDVLRVSKKSGLIMTSVSELRERFAPHLLSDTSPVINIGAGNHTFYQDHPTVTAEIEIVDGVTARVTCGLVPMIQMGIGCNIGRRDDSGPDKNAQLADVLLELSELAREAAKLSQLDSLNGDMDDLFDSSSEGLARSTTSRVVIDPDFL